MLNLHEGFLMFSSKSFNCTFFEAVKWRLLSGVNTVRHWACAGTFNSGWSSRTAPLSLDKMQDTTINCNYIYVLQILNIFITAQSNTFHILCCHGHYQSSKDNNSWPITCPILPILLLNMSMSMSMSMSNNMSNIPQSKMSARVRLGEVMHCSDEHPKYIRLFRILHVC